MAWDVAFRLGCCLLIGAPVRWDGSDCGVRDRFECTDGILVRRCVPSEFARFDDLLDEHHWLGRGLFGATVRQVAEIDGSGSHWPAGDRRPSGSVHGTASSAGPVSSSAAVSATW